MFEHLEMVDTKEKNESHRDKMSDFQEVDDSLYAKFITNSYI
jgi:hypothetical protein